MTPAAQSTSPPPLSLLSLSDAAASAHHIPVQPPAAPIPIKQRHRSSFSQSRKRRPSDARDPLLLHFISPSVHKPGEDRDRAASSFLQASTNATALALSPPEHAHTHAHAHAHALSQSVPLDSDAAQPHAKKKGTLFRCESCSKVYRHPSCLVKHRWEHSPHWREASKFLLSKHQQVQLLEAAAILSHLSPTESGGGTSLPEDRSLWPSYLSGGLLPLPAGAGPALTQFRPGLLGHPNPSPHSSPSPWDAGTPHTSTSAPFSLSLSLGSERGWSLPRSSVRGGDSEPDEEGDGEDEEDSVESGVESVKEKETAREGEEWDGMEMEMDL